MLSQENGKIIFCREKCTQCGVCLSVCPKKALYRQRGTETYDIRVNVNLCAKCGICVSNCAANLLPSSFPDEKAVNEGICYLAYSKNENSRFYASSGGVCRTFVEEALSLKLVDAVYSLAYSAGDDEEISGRWFIASPDTTDLPQSIYRVVLWGEHILDIPKGANKVLLIGLSCQLRAANNALKRMHPALEIINVAILCRKTKTLGFSRYIARLCGKAKTPLRSIRYRGEGWPGTMRIDGVLTGTPFVYHAICWNLNGCRRCFDSYYMDGDFTVGDPWEIVKRDAYEKGQCLLYVHSEAGQSFLRKISTLTLQPLSNGKPAELMGLGICRNKKSKYLNHPIMPLFYRIKKRIAETILSLRAFFKIG